MLVLATVQTMDVCPMALGFEAARQKIGMVAEVPWRPFAG